MSKYFFHAAALTTLLFFFAACAGQPRVPAKTSSQKKVLWDESRNPYADENDNVDVSDLDKEVTTGEEAGTTAAAQTVQRIPFPAAEYNTLARTGKGTIQGHIYLQDAYGSKIYGAKTRLYLNPVTSYSRQWYQQSYLNGSKMGKADPRLFNYLRFTASDDQGAFAFYGVPTGSYYLIGTVSCGSECGYASPRNIRIAKEVHVEGNQVVDTDLSRPIQ